MRMPSRRGRSCGRRSRYWASRCYLPRFYLSQSLRTLCGVWYSQGAFIFHSFRPFVRSIYAVGCRRCYSGCFAQCIGIIIHLLLSLYSAVWFGSVDRVSCINQYAIGIFSCLLGLNSSHQAPSSLQVVVRPHASLQRSFLGKPSHEASRVSRSLCCLLPRIN